MMGLGARTRAAGPSRLVFRVNADELANQPLTLETLLSWDQHWGLQLNPRAAPATLDYAANNSAALKDLSAPTIDETALEIPFRLFLSPIGPCTRRRCQFC